MPCRAYYRGVGIKVYRGVHNIRNRIPEAAVNHPSEDVKQFCRVPINRYFTTTAIPGFKQYWLMTDILKKRYDIKNPMDLVAHLRHAIRGRGRLCLAVMASVLADFFEDVCEVNRLALNEESTRTASICIAMMESRLPRTNSIFTYPRLCT